MFIKLCNIGQDSMVRYTPQGKAVTTVSCAYTVGFGANKKTQWIDAELWGERAEKLVGKLTKGRQVLLTADDVNIDEFPKSDSTTGYKLKCRVIDFDFIGANSSTSKENNNG